MSETFPQGLWTEIALRIASATGSPPPAGSPLPAHGGCIHRAFLFGSSPKYFVKINDVHFADAFASESDALGAIAKTHTVPVPTPVASGTVGSTAFLALTCVDMRPLSPVANARLGSLLAAMHRHTSPQGTFGWHRDNFIGATSQPNPHTPDWASFFCQSRLAFQFDLAARSGSHFPHASKFLDIVHSILSAHQPPPSLLHGDLWAGNAASDPAGNPVVFDPATYYGDRETDIAFTRLFGGFSPHFYAAYSEEWPLSDGASERADIYNLYHLLNHHNLFGGGYAHHAKRIMRRFL